MSMQQNVQIFANALAEIYNSTLPQPDPELPEETQQAMSDAMDDIRAQNVVMAGRIAQAIKNFVCSASISVNIPWPELKILLQDKISPEPMLDYTTLQWVLSNPDVQAGTALYGTSRLLDNGAGDITLTQGNALS